MTARSTTIRHALYIHHGPHLGRRAQQQIRPIRGHGEYSTDILLVLHLVDAGETVSKYSAQCE